MDFNHELWGEVVPDGPNYCHWGGRAQSQRLARMLDLQEDDRVLELCCGRGGLLRFLSGGRLACGIDISGRALRFAKRSGLQTIQGDAHQLPFRDGVFTKVVAQDADAWLSPKKQELIYEVARVTARGGVCIFQTYAVWMRMTVREQKKTDRLLAQCEYDQCLLLETETVARMFAATGFRITCIRSLHTLYRNDNERMTQRFAKRKRKLCARFPTPTVRALGQLLEWERELFRRRLWTGILVVARKER